MYNKQLGSSSPYRIGEFLNAFARTRSMLKPHRGHFNEVKQLGASSHELFHRVHLNKKPDQRENFV